MCRTTHLQVKDNRAAVEVVSGVLLLICGCAIYLLFRSSSLNIYKWCSALGLTGLIDYFRELVMDWNIPDVIRFSLPDGLYCAAYILIVDAIWHQESGLQKYIIISLVPIFTIGSELLQGLSIVRGTFDVFDLICYALPPFTYVLLCITSLTIFKKQQV